MTDRMFKKAVDAALKLGYQNNVCIGKDEIVKVARNNVEDYLTTGGDVRTLLIHIAIMQILEDLEGITPAQMREDDE